MSKDSKNQAYHFYKESGSVQLYALLLLLVLAVSVWQMAANRHLRQDLNSQKAQKVSLKQYDSLANKTHQLALQIQSLQSHTESARGAAGPRGPRGPAGPSGIDGAAGTGLSVTAISASDITTGTLADNRLSSDVTRQGDSFNSAGQLVQLGNSGALPAIDGSNLTNVNADLLGGQGGSYYTNAANLTGQLSDLNLSANISRLDSQETASGGKTFTGDVLIKTSGLSGYGSSTAFQVQNTYGVNLLGVDDTAPANIISNGSFEPGQDTTGWSADAAGMTTTINEHLEGTQALRIDTTTGAGGARYNLGFMPASTTFNFSVYAKAASGRALNNFTLGYSDNGFTRTSCLSGQTVPSGGWTLYSCKFTSGVSPASPFLYISAGDGFGAQTYYLDGAQLIIGSATAYGGGQLDISGPLSLSGPITSALLLQPSFDSTAVLQVQTSGGNSLLSIDSQNHVISFGDGTLNTLISLKGSFLAATTAGNDSTTAFQVQSSGGTSVLAADTTGNTLVKVSNLSISGTVTLNGHVLTGGTSPTIVPVTKAGTGATASISGNDEAGKITVTTGTGSAIGNLAKVTFHTSYTTAPVVMITATSASGASLQYYISSPSPTTFTLSTGTAPVDGTVYTYNYWVAQ